MGVDVARFGGDENAFVVVEMDRERNLRCVKVLTTSKISLSDTIGRILKLDELFKLMKRTQQKYSPENPIQAWTADMWAVLWNAWLAGHETKIIKRFNFMWATDHISNWEKTSIYHNAGAVVDDGRLFLKTKYQKSPFNQEIKCSDEYCSYKYVEEIK